MADNLKAENERLQSELTSMKKKFVVALKKAQSEALTKLEASEKEKAEALSKLAEILKRTEPNLTPVGSGIGSANGETKLDDGASDFGLEIGRLKEEIEGLKLSLETVRKEKDAVSDALRREQGEKTRAEEEVAKLKKVSEGFEAQLLSAASQISESSMRAASVQEEFSSVRGKYEMCVKQMGEKESEISTLKNRTLSLEDDVGKAREMEKALQRQMSELSEYAAKEIATAKEGAEKELVELSKKLEGARTSSERERSELSNKLKEANESLLAAERKLKEYVEGEKTRETEEGESGEGEERKGEIWEQLMEAKRELERLKEERGNMERKEEGWKERERDLLRQLAERGVQEEKREGKREKAGEVESSGSPDERVEQLESHKSEVESLEICLKEAREKVSAAEEERAKVQRNLDALRESFDAEKLKLSDEISLLREACQQEKRELEKERERKGEEEKERRDVERELERARKEAQEASLQRSELETKLSEEKEKCTDLDTKFNRLQKRAKQKIQELSKEKEDLEAQLLLASEKLSRSLSEQANQQESWEKERRRERESWEKERKRAGEQIERAKTVTLEAQKEGERERERLKERVKSLTEECTDLRRTLEIREHNLNESRRLAAAKEQTLLELSSSNQEEKEANEKETQSLRESMRKLQDESSLQVKELTEELTKARQRSNELQTALNAVQLQLGEMEAFSSGEIARMNNQLESSKAELTRSEKRHMEERVQWEERQAEQARMIEMLEKSSKDREKAANDHATQLEVELESQRQSFSVAFAQLEESKKEVSRLESELVDYKMKAKVLFQKRTEEWSRAKETEKIAALEESMTSLRAELDSALSEKERALHVMREMKRENAAQLESRDAQLLDNQAKMKDLSEVLESLRRQMSLHQEDWDIREQEIEKKWKDTLNQLEGKVEEEKEESERLREELASQQTERKKLEVELKLVKERLESEREERGKIERERGEKKREGSTRAGVEFRNYNFQNPDGVPSNPIKDVESFEKNILSFSSSSEEQILQFARQQARKEEEHQRFQQQLKALQDEIADLERERELRDKQEALLKEQLRDLDRSKSRENVDLTYLKNVVLKMIETGETRTLLPVISMLLHFSPDEMKRCQEAKRSLT